jgi:predicted metal-dependent hydrolase
MATMYVRATGADKAASEGLMKAETRLTDDQCKTLGFVSEIIEKPTLKAVAFIDENKTNNNLNKGIMNKISEMIKEGFANLKAELKIETPKPEPKAAMVMTDKGELTYASEGEMPEVGEAVMIGEELAPADDYSMEDGTIIRVAEEGLVVEIVIPEMDDETVEALQAKIEEIIENHAKEIDAMKADFSTELENELSALKADIGSNYEPIAKAPEFRKKQPAAKVSLGEAAKQRREEMKNK